ncbi:MAG: glycosyltransferase family 2 protein, partial [Clostridia bacterium]|nr:glycosyltransferase family 2 protein [Clostridia bacterium]
MFSIIVPVYRSEKYLRECIDSILAQTCGEFELILVDDGSPDTCPQICDEYALRDSRIKVIHKPNGGSVSARKAGLRAASGEYLCFVDGDDFVLPDMLERYKEAIVNSGADVLCAGYMEYRDGESAERSPQNLPSGIYDKAELRERLYPVMLSQGRFFTFGIAPSLCCKCFRTRLCRRVMENVPDNISL